MGDRSGFYFFFFNLLKFKLNKALAVTKVSELFCVNVIHPLKSIQLKVVLRVLLFKAMNFFSKDFELVSGL